MVCALVSYRFDDCCLMEFADDNVEDADVLVCCLITNPLILPDNLVGHCSICFRMTSFDRMSQRRRARSARNAPPKKSPPTTSSPSAGR